MGPLEVLGIAGSLSLLAGWRLYAAVLVTGAAMQLGWLELPEHLQGLAVLSHPWVLLAAGAGALAEFFADKIAWVDSLWDMVHTLVRPLGGALLALAVVDPADPLMQVLAFLLGGGATLLAHGAKSGTRALVNTSPEPFSNVAVSLTEDVATAAGFALLFTHPLIALAIAAGLCALFIWLLWTVWRLMKKRPSPPPAT